MSLTNIAVHRPETTIDFPEDATMLFCIGAQKAGTTWLHHVLQRNDDCLVTMAKEIHYFDFLDGLTRLSECTNRRVADVSHVLNLEDFEKHQRNCHALSHVDDALAHVAALLAGKEREDDVATPYLSYLLRQRTDERVLCDITPSYAMLDRNRFADMAAIGEARFIFILRDPVSRMWSQIRMQQRMRTLGKPEMNEGDEFAEECHRFAREILKKNAYAFQRANYARTMRELEAAAPAERILYLFFEDLFAPETLRDVGAFIGVDDLRPPPDGARNEGLPIPIDPENARAMRALFADQYDFVRARFGDRTPEAWSRWD